MAWVWNRGWEDRLVTVFLQNQLPRRFLIFSMSDNKDDSGTGGGGGGVGAAGVALMMDFGPFMKTLSRIRPPWRLPMRRPSRIRHPLRLPMKRPSWIRHPWRLPTPSRTIVAVLRDLEFTLSPTEGRRPVDQQTNYLRIGPLRHLAACLRTPTPDQNKDKFQLGRCVMK